MALLGSFIDVRTIASFASNASASFAHGLPSAPDFIIIAADGAATTAAAAGLPFATANATNVSLFAAGQAVAQLKVTSVVAHSIIR